MGDRLWTPEDARVQPDERKWDGGTYFDDEMGLEIDKTQAIQIEYDRMIDHLRQRPDHTVYVGSAEDRGKLREVFNHMFSQNVLNYHPNIRIEYGVPDGQIRIAE